MSSLDLVELEEFFDALWGDWACVWVCVSPLKVNYTCPSVHSSVNWF